MGCCDKNTLKQTRGDTRRYRFQRKDMNGQVITLLPEKIYFTVKKDWNEQAAVLQKTVADFTIDEDFVYRFTIYPDETESLKYGDYVFDVEVIQDGVKSTIAKGKFILTEEATFAENEV